MARLAFGRLMSGILINWTLPGNLEPQTPWKKRVTGLQSSDCGWNFESKHHHRFITKNTGSLASKVLIGGPAGLWTTYGPSFLGVLGSETSRQGSIHQNTRPKSSGDQLGHLWSDGDVLIKKFAIIIRVIGWQPFIVWLYYMATDDDKAHMVKSVNYPSHHNQTLYVISIGGFFINLGKSPLIY